MSSKYEVVISEFMDNNAVKKISEKYSVLNDPKLYSAPEKFNQVMSNATALIVRNQTLVDRPLLESSPNLKVIGRLGVGLDNIDVNSCKERNVEVIPATGANSLAVVEYVIAAMLNLSRGVFTSTKSVAAGDWPRSELIGGEIAGKTLGLVGFGSIAQQLASKAISLEMTVIAYDPFVEEDATVWSKVKKVSFETLLESADIISLHMPLTDTTRNMINSQSFSLMKNSVTLINTARGGIIDEIALVEALKSGAIANAAIDVFDSEPLSGELGKKFRDLPNLILTPHIAGVTMESNVRVSDMIAEAIISHLSENG